MEGNRLFFELIRVSIGNAERLSHAPTEEEWQQLFATAVKQTLAGVLFEGVKRLPQEQYPPRTLLLKWHNTCEKIALDNKRLNHDTVWASQRWKKLGYNNIILKGQGNALLYPNPLSRTSGDVDIWIDAPRKEIASYIKRLFPKEEIYWIEADFPVKKDTTIEVHFKPSYLYNPFTNKRMERYFEKELKQPKEVNLPDGPIQIPNDRMNLVFQLTHIYRHLFFEGIGLRQLMDYYYLIQDSRVWEKPTDKDEVVSVIRSINLTKFCEALMWVLQEVFGLQKKRMLTSTNEKEGRFLLKEIIRAGNFGHSDDRVGVWSEMSRWTRLTWGTKWALRLIRHYPLEVMWHPVYRLHQYIWRRWNRYL